ncbi:MAG: M28 family peptidase [Candidatus Rokubacteria bacterium]|nr:M28 family peptidase [Candidatus Rokubacteria bacterium]
MRLRALVLVLALAASHADAAPPSSPPQAWLLEQVKALSAPDTEGRASGTQGADRAAAHITAVFQQAGLRPGGDAGQYLQPFQVATGIRLGTRNSLAVVAPAPRTLALGREFTPLAVSADGAAESDLVFPGYGITAPDLGYDDYAGLDVRDKIVLVLSREPRSQDPASPFRRPEAYHYSERSHKIINARQHGARGILLVEHPAAEKERLPHLGGISQPWGILAAFVTRAVADSLLAPAGKRIADLAVAIDQALQPQSFAIPGTRLGLEVNLTRERGTAANVVGILPGTDPALREQSIVVGAHYDHLGRGGEGSLAPDLLGAIHPGADDNASGTAGVMALARAFAAAGGTPRTLVFVAFAGEEMGLLGSAHHVAHPASPVDRTVLMVNLDMVGRLREGKLYVAGVDSGTGLRALVADAARGLLLDLQLQGDPHSPSDHTSFYAAGRPVLFLTTGAHADYHRPSDTWDKIDAAGLETVATFAARVIGEVAAAPIAPAYVKIEAPPARGSRAAGYGPYLGVIPEFGESAQPGVKINGIRPGSPAEQAGVRAGDVIVKLGPVSVKTLNDLTFALRGQRPGDRVELWFLRDGARQRVEAVLQERRQ